MTPSEQRLVDVATEACSARGYRVERTTPTPPGAVGARSPPAIGHPEADTEPVGSGVGPVRPESGSTTGGEAAGSDEEAESDGRPVAIEPLGAPDPTTILSRLRNNTIHGRTTLFVVSEGDGADTLQDVLSPPRFVRGETERGCRRFFDGPDRIPLDTGGYAAHRTDTADFEWHEEYDGGCAGSEEGESKRLVLVDGDDVVTVLSGVDDLACPSGTDFRYRYRRGADKRFHVENAEGTEVGVFGSVRAMRSQAYVPISMPLVPEHLFPDGLPAWAVFVVDADGCGRFVE